MRHRLQAMGNFLAVLLLAAPIEAWSQQLDADFETAGAEVEDILEEIVVTGSRVARSNMDSPSPLVVFDSQQLLDSGITTLAEFARYLPQNVETISDSNSGGLPIRGSSGFNLRGIGLDGTLTLVNGRRVAPFGSTGDIEPFVDINAIPVAAIDRIEVLKDGASAIYGSEAVAGVVNIILKERIEGITAEAGYLTTTEGDGDEWDANIVGGWSNDATHITGTLSYFDRSVIYSRDREFSSDIDLSDRGGRNSRSSAGSPGTADLLVSGRRLADPECPLDSETSNLDVVVPGEVEFCRFNYAYFTTQQNPSERWGLTGSVDHEFNDRLSFFGELMFARSDTFTIYAPSPLFFFFVPEFHPDNPHGEDLLIRYRATDIGNRGFETRGTTWRAVAGLEGAVREWDWEAALMSSSSKAEHSRVGGILTAEFQDALLGLGGPNGDQFYNPFGLNPQNPQEVIDQFLVNGSRAAQKTEEFTADVQMSGHFGKLPGGEIGAAFGGQYRRQTLKQNSDEIELTGVIAGGGGFDPINVDRDIYSAFAEFVLPLHRTLEAQLAVRYDHYSDFGSTTNPKVGLGWRPIADLLIRASWGTSFRPPTFRELFDPVKSDNFGFVFEDPWRCPATNDFFDCFGRQVPNSFRGNPELQPDEGETLTYGFVWEPGFAPGLSMALDIWSIDHTNRIQASNDFFITETLLALIPPDDNPFVLRDPQTPEDVALGIPGIINELRDTYFNGDTLETRGVDFDMSYQWDTNGAGHFQASLSYTYLEEYSFGTSIAGTSFSDDYAGKYGINGGLPQHRGNLRLSWMKSAHALSAVVAYTGDYESWLNLHVDNQDTGIPFVIDDYIQLDLQYSYTFDHFRGAILRLGCNNCTDADPPVYNQTTFTEAFHEGRGMLVYLRWTQPF